MKLALIALVVTLAAADSAQRAVLEAVYKSTGGDGWTNSSGWLQGDDYCNWFGVRCTVPEKDVVELVMPNNGLKGSIPAELPQLTALKMLNLANNALTGQMPEGLQAMEKLQHIDLSHNALTGGFPAHIANATYEWPTLQNVFLSYNKLTGPIPEAFFGPANPPPFYPTPNLKVIDVSYNSMSGPLPTRAVRAPIMQEFLLQGNHFTGPIPDSMITWLNKLKFCQLGTNDWECPIPSALQDHCQVWVCHNKTATASAATAATVALA